MADIGMVDAIVAEDSQPPPPVTQTRPANPLLDGPILRTLVRLATPNILSMGASICIVIAETSYVGRLGTAPLAAIALMFPIITLMLTMSGGAMGGGVASAISRALGADDVARASALAIHALTIGLCAGLAFSVLLIVFGKSILMAMGGRGQVLTEAMAFSQLFFYGVVLIWLMNTLVSITRATGNMKLPSAIVFSSATCQILIGGTLSLGLFGAPQLGIRGIAIGQITGFTVAIVVIGWYILSGRSRISLTIRPFRYQRDMFVDILKVGVLACFYPIQSVLTLSILTGMLAHFGTEILAGYGIGARLEFLLTTIAFATGVASVPMVGMAVGAGHIKRARQVAWAGAGISAVGVGILGTLVAIFPHLWVDLFTDDAGVRAASAEYLTWVGPLYAFLGVGISLYFSSQGAAKVLGSVVAQTARLVFVVVIGAWLLSTGAGHTSFFILAAGAMITFGTFTAVTVWATSWGRDHPPQHASV
jgi:putative MATE family efflux protein